MCDKWLGMFAFNGLRWLIVNCSSVLGLGTEDVKKTLHLNLPKASLISQTYVHMRVDEQPKMGWSWSYTHQKRMQVYIFCRYFHNTPHHNMAIENEIRTELFLK